MNAYLNDIRRINDFTLPWEQLSGANILVTGATGLIGSALVDALMLHAGHDYHVYAAGRNEQRAQVRFADYLGDTSFHFLKYDVMEPFRVPVDYAVYKWATEHAKTSEPLVVDRAYKEFAHGIMKQKYAYRTIEAIALETILELVLKSLRDAYMSGKTTEYRPWIWRNSEWDG